MTAWVGPPDSKSLVLAYWLEEPANHVGSGRGLGAQEAGGLELSLHPTWLCGSDCLGFSFSLCAMGPAIGSHSWLPYCAPGRSHTNHNELQKGDRGRESGKEDGDETNHQHSPRAQKTLSLLESGKDTFKTSLWLSKSSSGPPQLSTIGDMSCRSGRVTSETNAPIPSCCGICSFVYAVFV